MEFRQQQLNKQTNAQSTSMEKSVFRDNAIKIWIKSTLPSLLYDKSVCAYSHA